MREHSGGARIWLAVVALAAALAVPSRPALAACHAFTVEADPSKVAEGAEVTVTVRRDAAVGPSQIDVETVDGTARGGADYEPVERRTVSFSSETEQSFTVPTREDAEAESDETFRLHLSNPGGCAVNPNYVEGPDAEVTIADNDESSTVVAPAPTSTTGGSRVTTSAPQASTSTSVVDTASSATSTTRPTSTTTRATDVTGVAADAEDDDASSGAAIVIAAAVILAVGGGGVWLWRRRLRAG